MKLRFSLLFLLALALGLAAVSLRNGVRDSDRSAAPGAPPAAMAPAAASPNPAAGPGGNPSVAPEIPQVWKQALRRDTDGLAVAEHPDGRRSLHLGGRFRHVAALVPAADGGAISKCFSDDQEMTNAVGAASSQHEKPPAQPTADF